MKTSSHQISVLILALTLVSCGAKNKGKLPANISSPTPTAVPTRTVQVTDTGSSIVVLTSASSDLVTEEVNTVTIPEVAGPVLVQVISPEEVTETLVNVDPAEPNAVPEVVVEIILPDQRPVVDITNNEVTESSVNVADALDPEDTISEAISPDTTGSAVEPAVEVSTSPVQPGPIISVVETDLINNPSNSEVGIHKEKVFKRIAVLEHLIEVHSKKAKLNTGKLLEWKEELRMLKASL